MVKAFSARILLLKIIEIKHALSHSTCKTKHVLMNQNKNNANELHKCSYEWSDECHRLSEIFKGAVGDIRGKECIRLNLDGSS